MSKNGIPRGDLFWGASLHMYNELAKAGLLFGHVSAEPAGLPKGFGRGISLKDTQGRWWMISFLGLRVAFKDQLLAPGNLPKL